METQIHALEDLECQATAQILANWIIKDTRGHQSKENIAVTRTKIVDPIHFAVNKGEMVIRGRAVKNIIIEMEEQLSDEARTEVGGLIILWIMRGIEGDKRTKTAI